MEVISRRICGELQKGSPRSAEDNFQPSSGAETGRSAPEPVLKTLAGGKNGLQRTPNEFSGACWGQKLASGHPAMASDRVPGAK